MHGNMITDSIFLEFAGGIHNNSLIKILNMKKQAGEMIITEPNLIRQSSYYDYDKFKQLANTSQQCFTILSSNIQSINTKFDELKAYVTYLSTINFKFSVICLQECCISNNDDLSLIQLNGYNCITQGKSCSAKGGLIVYLDDSLDYELIMTINNYEHWEGQVIQVSGGSLAHAVTIVNLYRPPRPSRENYQNFIDELSTVISTIKQKCKKNIILAGDFNINLLKINEQDFCSNFFDTERFQSFPSNYFTDQIFST